MRVSSPIGDLPFEPTHIGLSGDGLLITGQMGAWPAEVHVGADDLPAIVRLIPKPLAIAVGGALALAVASSLSRSRRSRQP